MANRFLSNIKINDAYTFPASDGIAGQVVTTDGAGNLGFSTISLDSGSTVIYQDNFTGDNLTTTFTLANSVNDEVITQVYIDGVYQSKLTYSTSGDQLIFTEAPFTGASIEVISMNSVSYGGFQFDVAGAADNDLLVYNSALGRWENSKTIGDLTAANLTATSFIKSGGTSSQFLKADGSVDSNSYLTSYTESDTLQSVTDRGATTTNTITISTGTQGTLQLGSSAYKIQGGSYFGDLRYTAGRHRFYEDADLVFSIDGGGVTSTGSVTANSFIKSGGTSSQFLKADGSVDSTTYQNVTEKGQALGYVPLDSGAKIDESYLPDSIVGQVEYQGTWNAATNTPTLSTSTTPKGHYYIVSVGGTFDSITYAVGDWIISDGTTWNKVDNTDAVTDFNGRLGSIVPLSTDYDSFFYTKTLLDGGQLDNRYYTETELDAGQLDNRYYTETESDAKYLLNTTDTFAGKLTVSNTTSEYVAQFTGVGDTNVIIGHSSGAASGEQYISYTNGTTAASNNAWMVGMDDDENFKFAYGTQGEINGSTNVKVTITQAGNTTFGGSITASSFVKSGGTSSQFLKADGSVDSNSYLTSYTESDTLQSVTNRGSSTTNTIVSTSAVALSLENTGTGTYNKTVIYNDAGGFLLEGAKATDSNDAAKLPVTLTWRGNYNGNGGLKLNGDTKLYTNDSGLGIDETNPSYPLDVNGNIRAYSAIRLNSSATGDPYLALYQNMNEVAYLQYVDAGDILVTQSDGAYVLKTGGNSNRISVGSDGMVEINSEHIAAKKFRVYYDMDVYNTVWFTDANYTTQSAIAGSSGELRFYTNSSSNRPMTLTSGGSVLIGRTSNATSQALQVEGFIDQTDTSAAFRLYNGSTFIGGIGNGNWAYGATWNGYYSIYANSSLLLFNAGGGNSPTMALDNNGNLGIGTTSPNSQLHINESTANTNCAAIIQSASWDATLQLQNANGTWEILNDYTGLGTTGALAFYNSGYRMVIDNTGKVGIGTTSPSAPLHVLKSSDYSAIISRADWNVAATKLALGAQYGVLGYISTGIVETVNDTTYIALNYKNGLSSFAEGLRVYNNGNVGIGTTSPSYRLDVQGGSGIAARFQTTNDVTLQLESSNSWTGIRMKDGNGQDDLWFYGGSQTWAFGGGGSTTSGKKMHINGGVSIGSGAAAVAMPTNGLYVEGGIYVGTPSTTGGQNTNQSIYIPNAGEYFTMGYKLSSRDGKIMHRTNGTTDSTGFYIEAGSTEAGGICLDQDSVNVYGSSDAGTTFRVIDKDAGVVTFEMLQTSWNGVFRGDVIAYGSMSSISDIRIKENIEPYENVLDRLCTLGVYSYNKITAPKHKRDKKEIGVIAQEMQVAFPELVETEKVDKPEDANGLEEILTVDYEHLTAILLQSVKELREEVNQLKERLDGSTK